MSIADLHQRLENIHCPFVKYDSDWVSREVLTQGQTRQDILLWLFDRFDGGNSNIQSSLGENETSNTQILFSLSRTLGVCGAGDLAVVEGSSSVKRQLEFFHGLLDLVELSVGHSRQSLDAQIEKDMSLLTSLSKENLTQVLSTECTLIPQDLLKQCPEPKLEHRSPDILDNTIESLRGQLDAHTHELRELESNLTRTTQPSSTEFKHLPRSLSLSLTTFVQVAGSFVRTFETDFRALMTQPMMTQRAPRLVGAGPAAQRALIKWKKFQEILNKLKEIQATFEDVCNIAASCVKSLKEKDQKLLGKAALEEMNTFLSVIKASIHRKEDELAGIC